MELLTILKAVEAMAPEGVETAIADGTGKDLPLLVVSGAGEHAEPDATHGGGHGGEFSGRVWLTSIAEDGELALSLMSEMTRRLTPNMRPGKLLLDEGVAFLVHRNTSRPEIDRSLTKVDTNVHPAFVWALFDVHVPAQRYSTP